MQVLRFPGVLRRETHFTSKPSYTYKSKDKSCVFPVFCDVKQIF